MATDTYQPETQTKKRGGGCLKGCLIAVAVMVVIGLLAGWYISRNWRSWASGITSQAINNIVDQSGLPAQEIEELKAEAKRVTDGIADGSLSGDQLQQILTGVVESPLLPMFMVKAVEIQYLDKSGLSDEEKAEGKLSLQRYARGLADEQIDQSSTENVMVHIADKQENGEWKLRETVTDEQLKAFLAATKKEADDAGVAEDVEPIDPSAELKKIIDRALGQGPDLLPDITE